MEHKSWTTGSLPQGQLTLSLLNHSEGLGKEMILARLRARSPHDSAQLLELWAFRHIPGCRSATAPGTPVHHLPLSHWFAGVLWVGFPT